MQKKYLISSIAILWLQSIIIIVLSTFNFSDTIEAKLEVLQVVDILILNSCLTSICIYISKSIAKFDRQIFIYLILYCFSNVIWDFEYIFVHYILGIVDLNKPIYILGFIVVILANTAVLVYYTLLVKSNLKIKNSWFTWSVILLIDSCFLYILIKFNLKTINDKSLHFIILQKYLNIIHLATFSLALYVLICAMNIGVKLIAVGISGMTGVTFLNAYAINFLNKSSSLSFSYDLVIFFVSILLTGSLSLAKQKNNSQFNTFMKEKSIKSIIIAWTLCSVVFTMFVAIILADHFGLITTGVKPVLPYIMFMYMVFAIFISLIIAYVFERAIQQLNGTIKSFISKQSDSYKPSKIDIDEFAALNDVFIYTMNLVVEKNKKEELNKLAAQVAHDIASPLFAISTVIPACDVLPEDQRTLLRLGIERISGIANHLLSHYTYKLEEQDHIEQNQKSSILVSMGLMEIIAEKKYEYKYSIVEIKLDLNPTDNFEFIGLDSVSFKRMMSNIINNAIDAIGNKAGLVDISFKVSDNDVIQIRVKDNGKGMSTELVNKIMNKVEVSEGKDSGHGIGFTQIQETVEKSFGKLEINSKVGEGTEIILSIPTIERQGWISNEINLNSDDTVIVLDDDSSIHGAWDAKFSSEAPNIILKHFTLGREVIDYVNVLPENQKDKIFLLTDFELLKQGINGLQVLKQLQIKRAILVTSHYTDVKLQQETLTVGSKILPKALAFSTSIKVEI